VARKLVAVSGTGMAALGRYLASGEAVAFLGRGVSVPLYPLWAAVIGELIDGRGQAGLEKAPLKTCRDLAGTQPDAVVDVLRRPSG
jgi:hypothetical protein